MKKELIIVTVLASAFNTTVYARSCIKDVDVIEAQKAWGDAIVEIGKAYSDGGDYQSLAASYVDKLYAYDEGTVLFKPTKASEVPFRLTEQEAVSYFVTGVVPEDHGFALQPWSKVRFENAGIIRDKDSATAMGHYFFTDANTGEEVKVEYTLEYMKGYDGKMQITVHHSSFPYQP
jgi:hypothetical protein